MTLRKLSESFTEYNPSAVGIHGGKYEGYICLSGLEELNQFVKRIHGSNSGNGELWEAFSEFDPELTSVRTATELLESLEEESTAVIKHKQGSRKQKNKRYNSEDGYWGLVDSLGLFELSDK